AKQKQPKQPQRHTGNNDHVQQNITSQTKHHNTNSEESSKSELFRTKPSVCVCVLCMRVEEFLVIGQPFYEMVGNGRSFGRRFPFRMEAEIDPELKGDLWATHSCIHALFVTRTVIPQ